MIKLFTHTDLDGVGCAILAKFAFSNDVDVEYCNYDDIDSKVEEYFKNCGVSKEVSVIPNSVEVDIFDRSKVSQEEIDAIREKYGLTVCPIQIPIIDGDTVIGFANLIDMKVYTFERATGE